MDFLLPINPNATANKIFHIPLFGTIPTLMLLHLVDRNACHRKGINWSFRTPLPHSLLDCSIECLLHVPSTLLLLSDAVSYVPETTKPTTSSTTTRPLPGNVAKQNNIIWCLFNFSKCNNKLIYLINGKRSFNSCGTTVDQVWFILPALELIPLTGNSNAG